jgi:hypothetical protein
MHVDIDFSLPQGMVLSYHSIVARIAQFKTAEECLGYRDIACCNSVHERWKVLGELCTRGAEVGSSVAGRAGGGACDRGTSRISTEP